MKDVTTSPTNMSSRSIAFGMMYYTSQRFLPKPLKDALLKAGRPGWRPMSFYQIDPASLDTTLTTVYRYDREKDGPVQAEDFSPFDPQQFDQYATIPPATEAYYTRLYTAGKKPLLFHRVPHILYKGPINVTNTPIVTV